MTPSGTDLPQVTVREMTVNDLKDIMLIEKVSFPTPWSENMFRKELKVAMARNLVAVIKSARREEIIGYINFWIFADEVHLNNIAVRKDQRGKGVASRMMAEMIQHGRKQNARWGTLEVRETNFDAIRLYERYGFVIKGVRPNYYHDSKEDALVMWCDLKDSAARVISHDA